MPQGQTTFLSLVVSNVAMLLPGSSLLIPSYSSTGGFLPWAGETGSQTLKLGLDVRRDKHPELTPSQGSQARIQRYIITNPLRPAHYFNHKAQLQPPPLTVLIRAPTLNLSWTVLYDNSSHQPQLQSWLSLSGPLP